jgi:ParB family chromosome partitioning protein
MLSVEVLFPHPENPRKDIGDVTELAESIKARGIMQNLTVVPKIDGGEGYTVIIGHRRLTAAKAAGISEVPCVITEMSEKEQLATMLLENMQRSDLTVYEQARGFQLMIDLGESVADIAEKTGFSQATVRRRVKMAELDEDKLKEVSQRQLSLDDFDKLAKISDIKKRNEVLEYIGTNNFDSYVNKAVKDEIISKYLPGIIDAAKALNATKIERSDTYSGKYQPLYTVRATDDNREFKLNEIDKIDKTEKLYYSVWDMFGEVTIYKKKPKPPVQKKSAEEIQRERDIAERKKLAEELSENAKQLRRNFAKTLVINNKNRDTIIKGAADVLVTHALHYMYSVYPREALEFLDIQTSNEYLKNNDILSIAYREQPERVIPALIYLHLENDKGHSYCICSSEGVKHYDNSWLNALYDWLISLGYEMSDDEKALRDGTHAVFGGDEE